MLTLAVGTHFFKPSNITMKLSLLSVAALIPVAGAFQPLAGGRTASSSALQMNWFKDDCKPPKKEESGDLDAWSGQNMARAAYFPGPATDVASPWHGGPADCDRGPAQPEMRKLGTRERVLFHFCLDSRFLSIFSRLLFALFNFSLLQVRRCAKVNPRPKPRGMASLVRTLCSQES